MTEVPIRAITRGPKYHWFGYYDKLQFDPTGRYVLGMEVDFEHRSPRPEDGISIGMIDLEDGDRWTELTTTHAWCWQQGCMLQWLPGSGTEIIWNDRVDGRFVCHILEPSTGKKRTLPFPIYTVSPDGRTGFATDFGRVNDVRPGYGYAGIPDLNGDCLAPENSGIWRVDLQNGAYELIVSIADVAAIPFPHGDLSEAKHYFNHLLVNTDGSRLEFLHRWVFGDPPRRRTRMLTCAPDGSEIRVVDDCGLTSHFIWHDPHHILAWSGAASARGDFCLFDERAATFETVGSDLMTQDGHVNCLLKSDWLVNDAYPDVNRERSLYLYHLPTERRIDIGRLFSGKEYDGEWRCDLHPRLSPDGRFVTIDSVHEGDGRQIYLLDVSSIVSATQYP